MFINENNIVCNIKGIHLIINTENGAVVGVDDESLEQYQRLFEETEPKIKNRELYHFLLENEFISINQLKNNHNGRNILTAYYHVTNYCNLHCLGCYSDSIARNKKRDLSTESMLKILNELKTVGVQNLVISGGEPLIRKDVVKYNELHSLQMVQLVIGNYLKNLPYIWIRFQFLLILILQNVMHF